MVAIVLAIVGVLVGVLIADARVPAVRPAPLIAALGVGIAIPAGLVLWQPSGLLEGVAYALGVIVGAAAYAARAWSQQIPAERRPGAGSLMWMAFRDPEHLRALSAADADSATRSLTDRGATDHARR